MKPNPLLYTIECDKGADYLNHVNIDLTMNKPKFPVGTQVTVDPEGIAKPKYVYNPIKEISLGEGGPKSVSAFEGVVVKVELFEDGYRYNIKGGSGGVVTRYYIREKHIYLKEKKK